MKRITNNTRIISTVLCCVIIAGCFTGCKSTGASESTSNQPSSSPLDTLDRNVEATPINYSKLAEELAALHGQNPDDLAVTFAYAEKLVQLGDVKEAAEVLDATSAAQKSDPQAILLSAKIAYLTGSYKKAETLYDKLLDEFPDYKSEAEYGLQFVYYQTNQYQKAQKLSGKNQGTNGITTLMQAYGERESYRVAWDDKQETTIPFVVMEPLPVVEAELNGQKRYFLIDTGADDTYLNESVANEFGLKTVATKSAPYAGGVEVTTNYGIADSLRLGGVTVGDIPVNIANMDHLANIAGEEYPISGVIGIGVFKQFLITMDYLNGTLILKPRGTHLEAQPGAYESSFIMAEMHYTICKALVNGKKINVWTDSGLGAEESLLLTDGIMQYLNIPLPKMETIEQEGGGGLGGSDFPVGTFNVDTYEMGNLPVVHDMKGLLGALPGNGYEESEIFLDGIISHNYLKQYKWTMDFDTMTMTFQLY